FVPSCLLGPAATAAVNATLARWVIRASPMRGALHDGAATSAISLWSRAQPIATALNILLGVEVARPGSVSRAVARARLGRRGRDDPGARGGLARADRRHESGAAAFGAPPLATGPISGKTWPKHRTSPGTGAKRRGSREMTKHSTRLAAALAVMVAPALATAETVRVGVVMTYSGGGAQFAQQIERAMELYLEQEGRAKLGEHEIELIKRDARNPGGDAAKTAVQELIVREDVDLLTGFVYSPNIIASAPLIDQGKVPTLVLNAATAWIPSLSPYIARVSMTMWQTGYPMGGYAFEKLECDTAAVGYTDYPPGKDALEAFRLGFEQAGGELIDAIPMGGPAEVPDFTPFMQRVKDAAPDCFFVFVPSGNHVAAVFKTYAD